MEHPQGLVVQMGVALWASFRLAQYLDPVCRENIPSHNGSMSPGQRPAYGEMPGKEMFMTSLDRIPSLKDVLLESEECCR